MDLTAKHYSSPITPSIMYTPLLAVAALWSFSGHGAPPAGLAVAARVHAAPAIDGRDTDAAWRTATLIQDFRQVQPRENEEPTFRTEARVAYDAQYLYVLVRAFDPVPDSIVSLLSRRDVPTPSDRVFVIIDSYRDRKSGFVFATTPAAVKTDAAIINDLQEDGAWDGVWDVATRVDEEGWVAEFRIPFSQLRFRPAEELTFGLGIGRDVARSNERITWPAMRRSRPGISSQLGELSGLKAVARPRHIEIAPYVLGVDRSSLLGAGRFGRAREAGAGVDLRLGLASGVTLSASVNPDFGQVEADPSVVNLTAFEQIYEERRPFFMESAGLFRYDITCGGPACNGLFYSRRIGRAPQLASLYGEDGSAASARILGATKLTGRTSSGLAFGMLHALTGREAGSLDRTIEPQSQFTIGRLQQDFRAGQSNVGLMVTSTRRSLDQWTRDYLRDGALVAGVDTRSRFARNTYMVRAYAAASHVTGSPDAMLRTRRSSVHYYQRPDDGFGLDSAATALDGFVAAASAGKVGGLVRYGTAYRYTSKGFEPNDAGFLQRADYQAWQNNAGLHITRPTRFFRSASVTGFLYGQWNASGEYLGTLASTQGEVELHSQWVLRTSVITEGLGRSVDDRLTRGGPAVRRESQTTVFTSLTGDRRLPLVPHAGASLQATDATGSWSRFGFVDMGGRVTSRLQGSVGVSIHHALETQQWAGNFRDSTGAMDYTFTGLERRVVSMRTRLDVTASPTLSLQVYAAPFVAVGRHSDWRALADAGTGPAERFRPYTARGPASQNDFGIREFRSTTVLRWEYRPGSVLHAVWSQGRNEMDPGARAGDLAGVFAGRPDNTVMLKASYWIGR